MTTLDLVLAAAFAVALPVYGYVTWPAFVAAARAGKPGVRVRAFVEGIVLQWSLTGLLAVHWSTEGRPWTALGLDDPLGGGVGAWLVVVALVGFLVWQVTRIVAASPEELAQAREQIGELDALMPHDRRELRAFMPMAVTAGVCEELFFRGFLPWLLVAWQPTWSGTAWPLVVTTVLFGLGHAYQGPTGIAKTMAVGAIMAALVGWSGVLWPAMVLHAVIDIHGGTVGWLLVRRDRS